MSEYYTAEEVDALIANAKADIKTELDKVVTLNSDEKAPDPSENNKIWVKVLSSEN